ncbi:ankyrin [Thozetella sp. PMI_491]|nr:ankyrin [Thozetella sp. PMI_491]
MFKRLRNTLKKKLQRGGAKEKRKATDPPAAVAPLPRPNPNPKPKAAQPEPPRSLLWAVSNNQADLARRLLREGASPHTKNKAKISVLHIAARDGNEPIVQLLLEAGARPTPRDPDTGATPLHRAAENGHSAVVHRLLKAGAVVDAKDTFGLTPVNLAARNGHDPVVQILLDYGATGWAKDGWVTTACRPTIVQLDKQDGNARPSEGSSIGLLDNPSVWDAHWEAEMGSLRQRERLPALPDIESYTSYSRAIPVSAGAISIHR